MKRKIMSSPEQPETPASNVLVADFSAANIEYKRMIAFIEPLAFLQFQAQQYEYTDLSNRIQKCVDEIYRMLEVNNYCN